MGAESGWAPPVNFEEMLSDMSRVTAQLQRRNRTPRARDIMGPGLAPRAVEILDWNTEETTFNGIFFTGVGSLNSPDPTAAWIGDVQATTLGSGVMTVTELATFSYDGVAPRRFLRAFRTAAGATREFTAWEAL